MFSKQPQRAAEENEDVSQIHKTYWQILQGLELVVQLYNKLLLSMLLASYKKKCLYN